MSGRSKARAKITYTVTHGNAFAVYFCDPEGNRAEVYSDTGLKAREGYLLSLNLNDEPEIIKQQVADHVEEYG